MFLDAEERHTLHGEGQRMVHRTEVDFLGHGIDPECRSPRHRMVGGLRIRNVGRDSKVKKKA